MVRVVLENRGPDSGREAAGSGELLLRVEGHSGAGVKGTDVVCAAISAIAQTAVVGITKVAGVQQDVIQGEGLLETRIRLEGLPESRRRSVEIIIDTMLAGLGEIENEYPGSLEIIMR